MNVTELALDEAIATAATGDIWLFRGHSVADRAIQAMTNSPVNHVGMVVALDDMQPLLWHAELGRSLPDVWTGERRRGVQLHILRDAVTTWDQRYGQQAWVRRLDGEITREHEDRLMEVIQRFSGKPFPTTPGLIGTWLNGRFRRSSSKETIYCAELVAATYQHMGLLGSRRPPSWYDPGKFWSGDEIELEPPFVLGGELPSSLMHPAARGFDTSGERYERGRPDYPDKAVERLLDELGRPARVVDVGAGTGKLTRPLLARGIAVVAVEPAAAMREVLARTAAEIHDARADALPLAGGSVDAVVAGQAFHWFATAEALAEFARVLTPAGRLGLVWNRRDVAQPLQRELGSLMAPYRQDAPAHASDAWRAAFTRDAPFALAAEHRIAGTQTLDGDGLADRVLSVSFMAALPADERDAVEARVRALAPAPVELRYVTELYVYARR